MRSLPVLPAGHATTHVSPDLVPSQACPSPRPETPGQSAAALLQRLLFAETVITRNAKAIQSEHRDMAGGHAVTIREIAVYKSRLQRSSSRKRRDARHSMVTVTE